MLINGKRALGYIAKVTAISDIQGADNIELIQVLGWTLITKKNEFKVDDLCLYIEIDTKVPEDDKRFAFLEKNHFEVNTMKLKKFNVISQGLALPLNVFPELQGLAINTDVTDILKLTKIETGEERRLKAAEKVKDKKSITPFKTVVKAYYKFFTSKLGQAIARSKFWRKLFTKLLYKSALKKLAKQPTQEFPGWVKKTDEERIENLPHLYGQDIKYVATEKIDGTSATFALKRLNKKCTKYEIVVCSRNVRQSAADKHDPTNVYWNIFNKYNIEHVLKIICKNYNAATVALQGEIFGEKIQGNRYKIKGIDFRVFNLIIDGIRLETEASKILLELTHVQGEQLQWVPIIFTDYVLPDNIEQIKADATAYSVLNSQVYREGLVCRTKSNAISFKNVSREYLLKYHD